MTAYALVIDGVVESQHGEVDSPDFVGPPEPPPNNVDTYLLLTEPIDWRRPTETSALHWSAEDGMSWVESASIDELRARRIEVMSLACEQQIVAGFMCSALGEDHLYPAKTKDQINLLGSIADASMAGSDPDWRTQFWCADAAGAWEFRDHTVGQIQQVGKTGKRAILEAMGKNEMLRRQIGAATTAAEIEAITW
ncbi:hypothetical protein IFT68_00540 [Oxalobacteraceae sp. CFBP 13730]|nr:hypothetical protein [Oxalobacteraceae sp. CFBP 13730]